MVFKKQNDELKVYFTTSDKYKHYFSSAEEAFASINFDPDPYLSHPATVTEINNNEHSITIEWEHYPGRGKWKLYYADNQYTGLVCFSSYGYDCPLPSGGGYYQKFQRYNK